VLAVSSFGLSQLGRQYLSDPAAAVKELVAPALVWQAPSLKKEDEEVWLLTDAGGPLTRPREGEPLVMTVEKKQGSKNPFAMGVTVGRVESNDIIVDDHSVSRFHAYFQHDPRKDEWVLVDAESKNGTWVDAVRLTPNTRQPLRDGAALRFGDAELKFLLPEGLLLLLSQLAGIDVDLSLLQGSNR